jgi:5-methylcytosine-specific restriction protein A
MSIPIEVKKNGEIVKAFSSLQEVFRYFKSIVPYSNEEIYDFINQGIDYQKPWLYQGNTYEFITSEEQRLARKDRKTRKKVKIKFLPKNKEADFSEHQKILIEQIIDDPTNWNGLKVDFISVKFISISNKAFVVEVEEKGTSWRKQFAKKLCKLAALNDLCVPSKTSRELFDIIVERDIPVDNKHVTLPLFEVGKYYSRKDVYSIVIVPKSQQGGNWDTGYTRYKDDSFVFANVGTTARTGHSHPNRFDGNDLIWYGKKDSKLSHNSIHCLIEPHGKNYIFARENSNDPSFLFLGNGRAKKYIDSSPVNIIWSFDDLSENHPEILSEEVSQPEKYLEGSLKQVYVNVYERNPLARKKCIEHHGLNCNVCGFNFFGFYGGIGEDFIHVHHLKPLHEIGEQYEIDPIVDLIPVCPNCHAMLHKRNPAYEIDELKGILKHPPVDF